jgi:adenylosuccinate synthase
MLHLGIVLSEKVAPLVSRRSRVNSMPVKIIAVSGRVCTGKSTLTKRLQNGLGAETVSTKQLIAETIGRALTSRAEFQAAGDELDRTDDGKWIVAAITKRVDQCKPETKVLVVDSIRIPKQLADLRSMFRGRLTHVHLIAEKTELETRYQQRSASQEGEFATYEKVESNSSTEREVENLKTLADVVIQSDKCTEEDVYTRVSARIGLRPGTAAPCVDVIIGGQYGSEGKGNIVHYLATEYDVLVRVGGPNAGHKVFTNDGHHYTFHQLPSGAIANQKAKLVIGAGAVVRLETLLKEINDLKISPARLLIDSQAMMIEDGDIAWEAENLRNAIGSTASGAGYATARKILSRTPKNLPTLARDVTMLRPFVGDTIEFFAEQIAQGRRIMLEGTQGTTLSLHHGQFPHVTSRITTATGCLAEAGLSARHARRVIMVCRTYPIRVGDTDTGNTSGGMRQETTLAAIADSSGISIEELKQKERTSTTNRERRIAEFDWAQFRRSIVLNGPTDIALTFADYFSVANRDAYRYEQLNTTTLRFIEELEKVGGLPVSLVSTAFSHRNIIDRRTWSNSSPH